MEFLAVHRGEVTFGADAGLPRRITHNGGFWGFEPNSEFLVTSDEFVNTAHIDELGGRKVKYVEGRDTSRPVLPFLGDSFTFGIGVSDDETFASVLSEEHRELRILNLGNPGGALDDQRKTIALRHAELGNPKKYVFFFFMGNDFYDLMKLRARVVGVRGLDRLLRLNKFALHNDILRQSYFIRFAQTQLLRFIRPRQPWAVAGSGIDSIFPIMDVDDDEDLSRARVALVSELDALAHMQREYDFSSLIVAIPHRSQVSETLRQIDAAKYNHDNATLEPDRPNLLLKNSVDAARISFFDATPCLRAAADPSTLFYTVDDHFTAVGHQTFARCLEPQLKRFHHD